MASDTDQPVTPPAPKKAERYIRTFAGDMAVTQQGGEPDLVPYEKHQEAVASLKPIAPPVPAVAESVPATPTPPPPPEMSWNEQLREAAKARVEARIVEDEAAGIHRSTERPRAIVTEDMVSPLRTYADDFTDRVASEGASRVSILAAEQDAGSHAAAPESADMTPVKKALIVGAGVFLLLVGASGAYYAYTQYVAAHLPVPIISLSQAPIYYDEEEELSGEGSVLSNAIATAMGHPLGAKKVRLITSTSATTTRQGLFVALGLGAPSVLVRNIVGAESMFGMVNAGAGASPFFILEVASYNETFAGMLAWEPRMQRDLAVLYPLPIVPVVLPELVIATSTATSSAPRTATTSSSTPPMPTPPTQTPGFRDEVVANYDVRVYRDSFGAVVLLYGYTDQRTLVIAKDIPAFTEIAGRLAASRK